MGRGDLVVQESGFGLNLAPSVKLVYIKYLDSLERWLERLLVDENEFLDLNSELNVNAEVESYGSEKFTEDEESLHIDSTKSGMDVDANLIIDSRKSEKVENADEVKSVVVVETDGDEEGNNGDKSEVVELDLATFEESVSRHKRKRDSIYRMLNWVTGIAKDPCDPVVGSLPEWSKWKTYGNEECWKQVLVTREALFLKRNADSTSSAEGVC
ncbi:AT-RICH INTERACTIVE DOMAIN-CONTAINING PROTEIN 1 [Salix koriyanagi]|uniref:AT-RICH INTERACTIVE DOMAIN-CONTAINING PROTEIN 1 n=1 Tax=Salix koriyanagi TaxID=2511006 RepID=A0A9Q0Z677_9ROSI|nr:AT-RICH INTERACTIVE DOMAIN-CONTAINING PROTEIN 1 [Salix koriyanagi]